MKMKKERGLQFVPITLFASVMGIAGLTITYRLLEGIFIIDNYLSFIMTLFVTLLFLLQIGIVLYRLLMFKQMIKSDLQHPVHINFYGTISISLFLLATLYMDISIMLSFIVWLIGAFFQIGLTLYLLSTLFWEREYSIKQFNPTWFIPIVGNIVAPISGVYHVDPLFNWMFFSIGIVFTIIYYVLFVQRTVFHEPLPEMLLPSYFIIIAPIAIGAIVYINLTEQVDVFAYILYGLATYLILLFLTQLKRFFMIPFFISWWAYLFPLAAYINATIYMYTQTQISYLIYWALVFTILTSILMVYLLWKTLVIASKGGLTV